MKIQQLAVAALLVVALTEALPAPCADAATAPDRLVLPSSVIPEHYDVEVTPDAAHLTFRGRARITVDVMRATQSIVLNAADLSFDRVALSDRTEAPKVIIDAEQQTATFTFGAPLARGHYVLSIDYHGKIYQQASGFFALDYVSDGAVTKRALFTQFENSDARRFLPCWDEPARKATFHGSCHRRRQ